jgi:hypothetical protein
MPLVYLGAGWFIGIVIQHILLELQTSLLSGSLFATALSIQAAIIA